MKNIANKINLINHSPIQEESKKDTYIKNRPPRYSEYYFQMKKLKEKTNEFINNNNFKYYEDKFEKAPLYSSFSPDNIFHEKFEAKIPAM